MISKHIWIDMKNTHEPLFFKALISKLNLQKYNITSRNYAGINELLEDYNLDYQSFGSHGGNSFAQKSFERIFSRNFSLLRKLKNFDIAMNFLSFESSFVGRMRDKKVISFTDNEIPQLYTKATLKFTDHLILPKAISLSDIQKLGKNRVNVHFYDGYKEDIYVSQYKPDKNFLSKLPFNEFVLLRPEALKAAYVDSSTESIVPYLIDLINDLNENIVFLPRYDEDLKLVKNRTDNIYIPPRPLNGLDLCFHSKCVLTGSGTFAREAACLGVPAVSFFPGKLLAVDANMVKEGKVFHSRNIKKIRDFVANCKAGKANFSRSQVVIEKVCKLLESIINTD